MDRMVETRVKVRLAFVSIFILGIAAGALGVSVYYRGIESGRPSGWTGRFDRERYVTQMTGAVGLQPEQMGALNANEIRELEGFTFCMSKQKEMCNYQ